MDVLLIIDMQVASFDETQRFDASGVIDRINQLADRIRSQAGKVIFIQHDGTAEDRLTPFSPGWELLPALRKNPGDMVVRKTICDSFYRTELKTILDQLQTDRLFVTGCATDFCVDTTIRSAASLGYQVVAVSDCHTTADRPHLEAAQVIRHHNWIWQNLVVPDKKDVIVLSLSELLSKGDTA